jgi:molecular chaperone GrpE (heat shock protein)
MNDELAPESPPQPAPAAPRSDNTLGSSSIYRLCEELIALREMNNRQHKLFEQSLSKSREAFQASFNNYAALTQKAYQDLRREVHGEKRISLALLNELLDIAMELDQIAGHRPRDNDLPAGRPWVDAFKGWADSVEVQARKIMDTLRKHGIQPYDAVIGSPYNPAMHERVGSKRMEGMGPLLVAEQRERGYASQQPEFVLRRPKVVISE